jgi:hypothetical protein
MSRHAIETDDGGTLTYGFDRVPVPGYFAQKFGPDGEIQDGIDTRESCAIPPETCGSRSDVLEMMQKHGVPEKHRRRAAADLPL